MRLQLIFVVESDSRSKTDWIYIKESLEKYYVSYIKLSPVYMGGKGNYRKKESEVKQLISKFNITSSQECKSIVVYCFDCDDYEKNPEQAAFLDEIQTFCHTYGYEFVWFCHDIEEVYRGKSVSDNSKVRLSNSFKRNHLIDKVDERNLKNKRFKPHTSNLMNVLGKYLDRR